MRLALVAVLLLAGCGEDEAPLPEELFAETAEREAVRAADEKKQTRTREQ